MTVRNILEVLLIDGRRVHCDFRTTPCRLSSRMEVSFIPTPNSSRTLGTRSFRFAFMRNGSRKSRRNSSSASTVPIKTATATTTRKTSSTTIAPRSGGSCRIRKLRLARKQFYKAFSWILLRVDWLITFRSSSSVDARFCGMFLSSLWFTFHAIHSWLPECWNHAALLII